MDAIENRRQNLTVLVATSGGPTPLSRKLKLSGPSYLSQLTTGLRPVTEKTARKFERALGLPDGYLDRAPENAPVKQAVAPLKAPSDSSLLTRCLVQITTELVAQGASASAETQGELLTIVYTDALRTGQADAQLVARLVHLLRSA